MEVVDLTAVFRAGCVEIDRLMVYKIGDIVIIRGRTSDAAMAAQAGRVAKSLGYQRVANLIEIVPGLADAQSSVMPSASWTWLGGSRDAAFKSAHGTG